MRIVPLLRRGMSSASVGESTVIGGDSRRLLVGGGVISCSIILLILKAQFLKVVSLLFCVLTGSL